MRAHMRPRIAMLAFLAAIWALIFLPKLADREVTSIIEARVGITAREMWRAGEWVLPTMNGELRLQKPPLSYWAVQALSWLRGTWDDATLRLPFALFALGAVGFTHAMGLRLGGASRGFLAGVILLTSALFVKSGRTASADVALLFCVAGSWYFYVAARLADRAFLRVMLWIFLGLGILAKGPVVLAVVLLPMFVEAAVARSLRPFGPLWSPVGILAFLALSLAWPAQVIFRLSGEMPATEAIHRWYLESFGKILPSDGIDEGYKFQRHAGPFYFYLLRFPAVIGFWTAILVPWAVGWLREGKPFRQLARLREGDPEILAPLWALTTLVFFSLISEKKTAYLLPILPATSLWLARTIEDGFKAWRGQIGRGASWLAIVAGSLITLTLWTTLAGVPAWAQTLLPFDFEQIAERIFSHAGWVSLGLCALGFATFLLLKPALRASGPLPAIVLVGSALGIGGFLYDELRDRVEPQTVFRKAGREAQQATLGASQAAALGNLPAGLLYYADRIVKTYDWRNTAGLQCLPSTDRVLVRDRALERLGIPTPGNVGQHLAPPLDRFEVLGWIEAGTDAEKDSILVLAAR